MKKNHNHSNANLLKILFDNFFILQKFIDIQDIL
jgi:hypothetical protein